MTDKLTDVARTPSAAFTAGYEAGKKEGYSDGYEKGEARGWEKAIEAAVLATGHTLVLGRPIGAEMIAAAIRKLKKP